MTTSMSVADRPALSAPRGVHNIVLPHRFDIHEVAEFESSIGLPIEAGSVLVVDASVVRYMDRAGMDSLIEARLRCIDHGGEMVLAEPSIAARVILELSGRYDALNPIETAEQQPIPAGAA